MTEAERFQKAVKAILAVPSERAAEINRETEAAYASATKDPRKRRKDRSDDESAK